jgi:hypothetical protein
MEIERPFAGEWFVAGRQARGSAAERVILAAMMVLLVRSKMVCDRPE